MGDSTQVNDDKRTTADDLTARHFGSEIPESLTGPVLDRDAFRAGMILRYLGAEKLGREAKRVQVFQLPDSVGTVFLLWGTAQLDGKMKQLRKGMVVNLTYLGQDTEQVHQWRAQPFAGKNLELANIVKQHPYPQKIATLTTLIQAAAEKERQRRQKQGDGAPPHDDEDAPPGVFGPALR